MFWRVLQPLLLALAALLLAACAGLNASAAQPLSPTLPPELPAPQNTELPTIQLPTHTPDAPVEPTVDPGALPPCEETEGQVIQTSLNSQLTGGLVRYRVYLPPCYAQTERRYPYIIMLHGLGEGMDDSQWDRMGLPHAADLGYQRGSLPPMIIVMPNGNDSQYAYDPGPLPGVIVDELMPELEANFCTWNDPAMRGLGGLSRGGYWAYGIAFTYPDLFDRVGGHSPFFYEGDYPPFNPYNMVETAPGIERLTLYIDHGVNDTIVDENALAFVNLLRRRGIEPQFIVNPVGVHNEEYWASHTADYLAFYAADWPVDAATFPSCHDPSPSGPDS